MGIVTKYMQCSWAVVLVCAGGTLARAEAGVGFLPYQNPARVQNGQVLYDENCASCHGAQLEGEPDWRAPKENGRMPAPPHDASGHTWHHPDSVLFKITKFGTAKVVGQGYQSDMPGFSGGLTDQDILDVLAYIKSTWPERIVEMHNTRN